MTIEPLIPYLPHIQAGLNALAAFLLLNGYRFIKKKNLAAHKLCMTATLVTSAIFLTSYLTYHINAGYHPFMGQGTIRYFYFIILISHVVLAATLVPMVIITATLALKGNIKKHPRIARYTLPIWLYVSVTGVIIYLFAFHIYPN
ncbi:MAG: DUF420 domain-containing protein [Gammaproteobacteria bacterium]|nr:DUF420 domain-containing protein [Gammaproteobacteria bacterium]